MDSDESDEFSDIDFLDGSDDNYESTYYELDRE